MEVCESCFWLRYCSAGFAKKLSGACQFNPSCFVSSILSPDEQACYAALPASAELCYMRPVFRALLRAERSCADKVDGVGSQGIEQKEDQLRLAERYLIINALRRCGWRQDRAAKWLGVSPRALNYKIHTVYHIQHESWRGWEEDSDNSDTGVQ